MSLTSLLTSGLSLKKSGWTVTGVTAGGANFSIPFFDLDWLPCIPGVELTGKEIVWILTTTVIILSIYNLYLGIKLKKRELDET